MNELTAFQRDILWIVNDLGDPKGLAVKSELRDYYEKDVNHGRLYPNLDVLVDRGLMTKRARDKRTNEYGLTEEGRRALQSRYAWESDKMSNGGDQ